MPSASALKFVECGGADRKRYGPNAGRYVIASLRIARPCRPEPGIATLADRAHPRVLMIRTFPDHPVERQAASQRHMVALGRRDLSATKHLRALSGPMHQTCCVIDDLKLFFRKRIPHALNEAVVELRAILLPKKIHEASL